MRKASIADFETLIKTAEINDFRRLMRCMLDLTSKAETYNRQFGNATHHFVEACRNIVRGTDSGRLGKIHRKFFADSQLSQLLESSEHNRQK
jgi:hypothetical protein